MTAHPHRAAQATVPRLISMLNVYEDLGETSRRQILAALRRGPKNVSELVQVTGLKQPNVSNHLARMRARNVVIHSKAGRQVFYRLASAEIEAIVGAALVEPSLPATDFDTAAMAHEYAKAAVSGDESGCVTILESAFQAGLAIIEIYEDLITPAMENVGDWWKEDRIDVGQEHLATAITERVVGRAMQVAGPSRKHRRLALLGAPPGSDHILGLRIVADFLRHSGWKTLYLGSNVPLRSMLSATRQHAPELVLTTCSWDGAVTDAAELVRQLGALKAERPFLIGVGGRMAGIHADMLREAGADFSVASLRDFAQRLLPGIERETPVPDLQTKKRPLSA